ncbi:50S ribosomal protein L4 [bacterium]|nr:50S ribosomal protein L4 [bacterium]
MKTDIFDIKGQKAREYDLPDEIFAAPVKTHLIYDAVRYQLAKRRQGTVATKNKAAVRGGGIKPWRQKGTGRARAGSIRSPLWVGGGTVFGPQPRNFSIKVNKKARKGALRSTLSLKAQNQELVLMDILDLEEGKTRLAVNILADRGFGKGTGILILVDGGYENLKRATNNIPGVKVIDLAGLNVYDLLWYQKLIILTSALPKLEEALA